jgi:hypothetical protein
LSKLAYEENSSSDRSTNLFAKYSSRKGGLVRSNASSPALSEKQVLKARYELKSKSVKESKISQRQNLRNVAQGSASIFEKVFEDSLGSQMSEEAGISNGNRKIQESSYVGIE